MLNKVCIQGRLTRDPELRNTSNQTAVASFAIACNRSFKNAQGGYDADFLDVVAWRQTATFVGQNFHKGDMVVIAGSLQTRTYEKDGNKVKVTEIIAEEVNFCGGSSSKPAQNSQPAPTQGENLPFEV